ncbi:MAG: riboflavin synthase [Legionella sp.]
MFTGLIEQLGSVLANTPLEQGNRLTIKADLADLKEGESIAINGVCLTWLANEDGNLCFDLSPETLHVTTLANLKEGDAVNIERAMLASTRLGGHYVCGHVNTIAAVKEIRAIDSFIELTIGGFSLAEKKYLIPKGSITIDGVSLTINALNEQDISLMLVPHTLQHTTLQFFNIGQAVNVEFDYIAQIVAHNLALSG